MSRITVHSKNGTQLAIVESLELHDEWMAECYITVSVKSPTPVDFAIGDYIDYRNERYTIQYDPTMLKKARSGSYGEGFTYDNIKFVSIQDEIVRCDFNDIVLNENKIHYTSLPTFPFFCANVDDLLDRIQANLEELYPGQWTVICLDPDRTAERGELVGRRAEFIAAYNKYIGEGTEFTYEKTNVAETVDNITCWDALKKVHDDFDLNFVVRGRVVVVGATGYYTPKDFKYGKGNGLYELERIGDSSQQITTRLRAYGSTTNLPSRYYANLNMQIFGTALSGGSNSTDIDVKFRKDYFLNPWNGPETSIVVKIGDTIYPDTVAYKNNVNENIIINTQTADPISLNAKIYILSGVDADKWPTDHREYNSENLPDNMAVSRLMLPGFPLQSLSEWVEDHKDLEGYEWLAEAVANGFTFSESLYRPYIDSPNIERYGIRPSSIYFDGSNDNEDIHPTIADTGLDVVVAAEQIQDNGVYDSGDVPNFTITLPDLGFDLGEAWQKYTTGSIDMKDGMCGSRSFEIAKRPQKDENNHWVCEVKRTHDDVLDLWFPYKDFNIQANDHYVLSEIDLPDVYVQKNAEKLLKAAIDALSKNHAPRLTYQPRIDSNFMQRQHDAAVQSGGTVESLHDTIKAGDLFTFEDADLGVDASIVIDVLTIKEYGDNGIPSYEVTLRDEKDVSPIERIQTKVDSIVLGGVAGGGMSTRQIDSLIQNVGSDLFLSKNYDDEAQGNMRFLQSLFIGNALDVNGKTHLYDDARIDGVLRALARIITNRIESEHYEGGWDNPFGSGFQINERSTDHISFLSVDNLFVRMKAVFTELEIRKISYAGGNIIFSHAGSRIVSVQPIYDTCDLSFDGTTAVLDGSAQFAGTELHINAGGAFDGTTLKFNDASQVLVGYRCYLMKDDGTTATENWWRVDDQARCQTFNIDETGTYHNVSNSFYWRRVMAVGTELLEDGLNYDYVDLSVTDAIQGSTEPQAGDTIVQMGNRTDTERQGFISIQVAGEYAPSFEVYKGVNSYSLSGKRKICISPKYTEIRANRIIETTETGDYPLPHFRTEAWYTGMRCYYYDVVQHNGSSWLCIYPDGGIGGVPYTTEEPSENATYWRIFASEGKEGKTGGETLTVYAWNTSDETAPAISGNAYPPAGWSTRITDRPSGGDYYLWMAETKKNPDGVIDAWGIPACISGADGTPGEDAKNIEFIYKYDPNGYNGNTGQVSPSGAASGSDTNKQQDDWVPNGWYDRALAISEGNPDVYMSSRKYNASTETWGAFGTPTLWGHFGSKGIDGDGVQYVYKLFDHELTDAERTSNIPTKPAQPNPQGEWIPTGWSDDPQAPTSSMAFCYCSIIKEINGTWGLFEKLGLWSKWSEDGTSPYFADIDNEMESVACDSSGKTKAAFDQTVGVNMWHGSTPIAFTISTTSVTGITINTDATNKTIRFRVAANTSLAEVNDIAITLTASDGSGEVRTLHYVLNAVRAGGKGDPGDDGNDAIIYSLVPSVSSVVKKKDGSYSVQNVSCTRQKNVGGTITDNTTDGTITYKIDGGSTEHSYTNNTNIPVTDFTKSIQFIFRVNSKTVDVETIPLVADGIDGSSAAVALLTPQMVSIPTDKSGKVLNDFRQEIPISLTTNNEELRLSEVTILSGGTNVELGTAVLESHADSHTTFSGTTAVMPDAQFSGTTLVVESGSVLVPGSLIVKGAKNATITEHICEIQVKGYDHEMNEYTAKTSLSILRNVEGTDGTDGSDGDDAVNVSLSPQSVILTQNTAGAMPTLTDANTTINVKLGSVDVTSLSTILSATPSKYTVSGATYNTCTCSISGKKVIITAIDQHGTETISGETINKYCEEGYIDIVVRYNGVNTTVRFNFYCNLLGTWKREVVGDAEIVAAQKVNYIYDPSNPNQVVKQSDYGEYVRSSSENLARLNSEVEDPTTGLITKTSELKQTADGLSSDVSAIKMGKNLFKGALSADGWASEGSVPYTTPSGTVHIALPPDVGDDGWFNVVQSSHNYICRSYVSLKKNQWYVLSFYTKTTTAFNVTIYKTAASAGSWTTVKTLAIPAGSASTRRYVAFEMTGDTSDNNFFSFPVKTLRYPQLELGKDGTSTPTAFEVDSVTETSSRISQTADHIEAKVGDCGIDIDNKTITLTAEKTTVSGELTVPRVMNENADMVTTCEAGVVKVQSKSTASYGVFAINNLGEVVLQMYDKDGALVLNLGGTPNTAVNGDWRAVKFKRVDSGGSIADTRANFTATDVNCDPYYRLILGTVMNSGTPIEYYLPNGHQTTNTTVIGRNNRVFTSIYSTESAIVTGTFITDGYYVEKNDGIFMQEMSEYFPDEAKYFVNVYHYVSGKITEITKHYF